MPAGRACSASRRHLCLELTVLLPRGSSGRSSPQRSATDMRSGKSRAPARPDSASSSSTASASPESRRCIVGQSSISASGRRVPARSPARRRRRSRRRTARTRPGWSRGRAIAARCDGPAHADEGRGCAGCSRGGRRSVVVAMSCPGLPSSRLRSPSPASWCSPSGGPPAPAAAHLRSWSRPRTLPSGSVTVATRRPPPTSRTGSFTVAPAAVTSASFASMSETCQ